MVTCPICHTEYPAGTLLCSRCGVMVVDDPYRSGAVATPAPESDVEPAGDAPTAAPTGCGVDWCPAPLNEDGTACTFGHPVASMSTTSVSDVVSWTLSLPNGTTVVLEEGEPVLLGRHSPHPLVAAALASLDTVSRRHAEVVVETDGVRITHVGSTNPTYVNGLPIAPSIVVTQTAEVRLGQSVHLTLTASEGP